MAYHNNGIMVANVKELMDLWDFERNQNKGLNPKEIPVNSCDIAFWKCKNGHTWEEEIGVVYRRKTKCFYCTGRLIWSGENDLQTLYPELAAEWDYDKNDITPDKVSPRDTNTYWWKCKNGHPSFPRSVEHRVNRHDTCPYCSGKKVVSGVNDLETLFPKIAAEWDYEANNGVVPSKVSPNCWTSYNWICPKGHHYKKKVYLRTHSESGVDCTKCVKAHSTSFPEQAIFYYTKQFYPDAINRYKGLSKTGLELDIYIPSWNIGIEYDGKYSHSKEDSKEREQHKYEICKQKGIRLIRIREDNKPAHLDSADSVYYVKKRPNDPEMNLFLITFFTELTEWSHNHYVPYINPNTNKREVGFKLPVDINIKRDRPKILEYLIDKENSFGFLYPELAKNWDNEANKKLTPFMLTPGSNYEAFFKCERCGESWSATISTVVKWKRKLCKKCSMGDSGQRNTKRIVNERGSLGDFSKEAVEQWDYDANNGLTPYDIPKNYSKPVHWKCPVCGYKWEKSPSFRIHNNKLRPCPHCAGRVAITGLDDLETLYPNIAAEWDYGKNKNSLPSTTLATCKTTKYWICSKHHKSFKATPFQRINGSGCSMCKGEKIREAKGVRVEQYSKTLEYIRTFKSLNEAAEELNISPSAIGQAIKNGSVSANSYWKYENSEFTELKPDKKHSIVGVNVKTGEQIEFESSREAERVLGIRHNGIMKCCKKVDKYNTAGGYYWYFKGDNLEIRHNKTTAKPVIGINITTNEKKYFDSITAAAKHFNVNMSLIAECCKGKNPHRKTAAGHRWMYADK